MLWKHINKCICYPRGRYLFNTVNKIISKTKVHHLPHNKIYTLYRTESVGLSSYLEKLAAL
jgi:hypothetical protein